MLFDLTFPCYLTTYSGKKCLSGKVICAFFCPAYRSSPGFFFLFKGVSLGLLIKTLHQVKGVKTIHIIWCRKLSVMLHAARGCKHVGAETSTS
jgi:hypothetical protein